MCACNTGKMGCISTERHTAVPLSCPRLLLCQKQTKAKNDFHQYHKAHCQSTRGPLGNTPGDTGEGESLSQVLTFNFSKGTKQFIINRKEILIVFQKPLRQAAQMQASSEETFPHFRWAAFYFATAPTESDCAAPGEAAGSCRRGIQAKEKQPYTFTPPVPSVLSPPQVGGLLGHSALKQGDLIQVPHGDVSDDLCQVLVKQRENDDV